MKTYTQVNADWRMTGNKELIKQELGIEVQREGWYCSNTDTILIVKLTASNVLYDVHVWNNNTQLDSFKKLGKLPVFNC